MDLGAYTHRAETVVVLGPKIGSRTIRWNPLEDMLEHTEL